MHINLLSHCFWLKDKISNLSKANALLSSWLSCQNSPNYVIYPKVSQQSEIFYKIKVTYLSVLCHFVFMLLVEFVSEQVEMYRTCIYLLGWKALTSSLVGKVCNNNNLALSWSGSITRTRARGNACMYTVCILQYYTQILLAFCCC